MDSTLYWESVTKTARDKKKRHDKKSIFDYPNKFLASNYKVELLGTFSSKTYRK